MLLSVCVSLLPLGLQSELNLTLLTSKWTGHTPMMMTMQADTGVFLTHAMIMTQQRTVGTITVVLGSLCPSYRYRRQGRATPAL